MKKKFDGLLHIPASDGNFISGIQRLKDEDLNAMLERLTELDKTEGGHKGRVTAVEKELKNRAANSKGLVAVVKLKDEIQDADRLYLDGKPYDFDRIDNEVFFFQDKAGESLLEIGKRLALVKLHEDHGKFLAFLEKHSLGRRAAEYAMASARKFANSQSIANLGVTKMIALSVLDDDDIQKLEAGGDVAGMNLDDIDRMSTRELRENLRKEKEQVKKEKETRKKERSAFEQSLLQKDAKINELDMRLSGQEPPTKEQIAKATLDDLTRDYTFALAEANSALRKLYALLVRAEKIEGVNVQQLADWLDQFDAEMNTHLELSSAWTNEMDNAGPIADWRLSDLPGKEEAGVPNLG
jgi:hypothetical protein